MSGNGRMGGLLDPLGRGVCNIEVADFFVCPEGRVLGPGMMLNFAQFAGLRPDRFAQKYDLVNGLLSTDVEYPTGAYHSELFFSQDNPSLLVYTLKNTGNIPLTTNFDFGRLEMDIVSFSDNNILLMTKNVYLSGLKYSLTTNIPFGKSNFSGPAFLPWSKDVFLNINSGETLEIQIIITTDETTHASENLTCTNAQLFEKNAARRNENWRQMGFVVLPESDIARTFYRSLHWLQCAAGVAGSLPGECQNGAFSTYHSIAYDMQANPNLSNITPWQQRPFTYGAAGWATLAYASLGDSLRAANMLRAFYRPEALRDNVRTMFPTGEYEYRYGGLDKGRSHYLSSDIDDAFCFAHETLFDGRNRDAAPWDKQVHIQGFEPAMFYHYNNLYGTLTDTVYSVLRGSAEFWRSMLNFDPAQRSWTLPPLLSVTEDLFEAGLLDGLLAARWTLDRAAATAERLGRDPELRRQWKNIARNIHIPVREKVYSEFAGDDGSRAGAGYQGIRGYFYLGYPTVELQPALDANRTARSLDNCWQRNRRGEGMITFIANWFALADAYWGRSEQALEKMQYSVTQTEPVTSSMCEQNGALYYFLTGYASFTIVPAAMTVQSVGDEIRVFPAVPAAFGDIEFYNLPAVGGIRVSGSMRDGQPVFVKFEKDGKILLEEKNIKLPFKIHKSKIVNQNYGTQKFS
jgi:hypothetical protein